MALAKSTAKDMWFLGAGPFQSGTVYDGVQFAGDNFARRHHSGGDAEKPQLSSFREPALFNPPALPLPERMVAKEKPAQEDDGKVVPASAEAPAEGVGGG